MKRYKVVEQIWDTVEEDDYIKSMELKELVLEEVKEEKEHGKDCICNNCKTFYEDQPLTPKDVGMRRGEAMYKFDKWLWKNEESEIHELLDEEFDRLFQQFLSEYRK